MGLPRGDDRARAPEVRAVKWALYLSPKSKWYLSRQRPRFCEISETGDDDAVLRILTE